MESRILSYMTIRGLFRTAVTGTQTKAGSKLGTVGTDCWEKWSWWLQIFCGFGTMNIYGQYVGMQLGGQMYKENFVARAIL
ncbi:hypothetical protein QC760_005981 [Botrytis cinerea]